MFKVYVFWGAYLVDLVVGDPRGIPHPVGAIGKVITQGEGLLRKFFTAPAAEKFAGAVLALTVVAGTYVVTLVLIGELYTLNFWLGLAANLWLLSTTLAVRGLAGAAFEVYHRLQKGNLPVARSAVGMVVGRDTAALPAAEVVRAAVETVAENLVDGVVAPLFYAVLGGVPLAMAYKAVNTLDSMIGYKNERYRHFGWFAARLDDGANYLPARLVVPMLLTALVLKKLDAGRAVKIMLRDAKKHPSPNGGIPESLVAGGLGIQLGGENYYFGRPSFRATMGDNLREMAPEDIKTTVSLMRIAAALFAAAAGGIMILIEVVG